MSANGILGSRFVTRELGNFQGLPPNHFDKRDIEQVSIARGIMDLVDGRKGYETEFSDENRKRSGLTNQFGGLCFPTSMVAPTRGLHGSARSAAQIYDKFRPGQVLSRAVSLSNVTSSGAELVFTEPLSFIQMLRNSMTVARLGATIITDLVGPVAFPAQSTAGTLAWTAENPGSDVADSDMTFAQVKLSPKSAQSTTAYTRQLLAQASFDVEAIVRADLAAINALGLDLAAINGSGSANQPKGILNTAGIGSVAIGTNGGPPTFSSFINLQSALAKQNVNLKSGGYLTTPGVRGFAKQTPIVANFPSMIWGSDRDGLAGYPAMVSNQVPQTLTKGASGAVCHAAIFGNWEDLLIGEWGVLEIIVDPYKLKKQGIIEVTSFLMVDIALRYPVSFAADVDLIPTF